MLCQFTFENFKSYKDETTLDLQATKAVGFDESLLKTENSTDKFVPVSVIYGPNGGGKSNVLEALRHVVFIVLAPIYVIKHGIFQGMGSPWAAPFCFDAQSSEKTMNFELFFQPNAEYEYKYVLKILKGDVAEERMYRRKIGANSRITTIFERIDGKIEHGACIKKTSVSANVGKNMSYLSFLAVNYNLDVINQAIDWFKSCIIINQTSQQLNYKFIADSDDTFKKKLVELMNDVGINISKFELEQFPNSEKFNVLFEHIVNGEVYKLNIGQESNGTQKLFHTLSYVILALTEGRLLAFDELDANLHPKLLKFIIMLFKNPEINTNNAQLIFTSHDVSTMKSSVFRTDEIWFACKLADESSELYSLADIRDENNNHIQPRAAFDKQYLEGRYGADPYFRNMMDWK